MDGTRIIHGNALDLPLEDSSVDLVITSPPYFALRSYRDGDEHYDGQVGSEATPQEFLEALWAATREMVRVLKPTGSIFVNLGDKYAGSGGHNNGGISFGYNKNGVGGSLSGGRTKAAKDFEANRHVEADRRNAPNHYNRAATCDTYAAYEPRAKSLLGLPWRYAIGCVDQLGLILRAEIIWSKPNGLPESVTDRVRRSHEQWFHFTKSPRYFSAVDEIREAHAPWTLKAYEYEAAAGGCYNRRNNTDRDDAGRPQFPQANPLGKLPGSVWTIATEPLTIPEPIAAHYNLPDHFAAFPTEWPRRIILGWSPSGICTACGEGRRPVVEKNASGKVEDPTTWSEVRCPDNGWAGRHEFQRDVGATIIGYACGCPEPTVPTRPAVVLDPFAGTGTTVLVARALGRTGIGIDLSRDYVRLAEWRVFQSGHGTKAERRTWAERQLGLL